MSQIAFRLTGSPQFVLPVSHSGAAARAITAREAQAAGMQILAWPKCEITDRDVPERELVDHLPSPAATRAATNQTDDPAKIAEVSRVVRLAALAPGGFSADVARTVAASNLSDADAALFMKGLPQASAALPAEQSTTTTTTKESNMQANIPNTDAARQRLAEIKIAAVYGRADRGDAEARKLARKIDYARTMAAANGTNLFRAMADLGITLQ